MHSNRAPRGPFWKLLKSPSSSWTAATRRRSRAMPTTVSATHNATTLDWMHTLCGASSTFSSVAEGCCCSIHTNDMSRIGWLGWWRGLILFEVLSFEPWCGRPKVFPRPTLNGGSSLIIGSDHFITCLISMIFEGNGRFFSVALTLLVDCVKG